MVFRKPETNFRWVDIFLDFFEKFLKSFFQFSWKKEIVRKNFAIYLKMFDQKNLNVLHFLKSFEKFTKLVKLHKTGLKTSMVRENHQF